MSTTGVYESHGRACTAQTGQGEPSKITLDNFTHNGRLVTDMLAEPCGENLGSQFGECLEHDSRGTAVAGLNRGV